MQTLARLLCLAPLLLAGCGTLGGETAIAKSWQGGRADELVAAWGKPTRVISFSDGRKVLMWGEDRVDLHQPMPLSSGAVAGAPGTIQGTTVLNNQIETSESCVRSMLVTPTGDITSGEARGSGCCAEATRGQCAALLRKPAQP